MFRRMSGGRSRALRFGEDEPDTFRLVTALTPDQCRAHLTEVAPELPLHSFFFGTTEQLRTWQGKGRPVVGYVDEAGFQLEQKVLASPFRHRRRAVGMFEPLPNGTLIVYQLDFKSLGVGLTSTVAEIIYTRNILTSARWKRFDREESALFLSFITGALAAELVSQEIIDELRRPRTAEVEITLPNATSVDDFLAALEAVIRDSDEAPS